MSVSSPAESNKAAEINSGPPLEKLPRDLAALTTRQNIAWNTVGTAIYSAGNWGMQIVLAKLGTPGVVGLYALAVAISQPIILFSQLSLRGIQVTDVKRDHSYIDYFMLRLVCTIVALVAIGGVSVTHDYVKVAAIIFVTGLGMAFDSISDVIYGLEQQFHRMDRIAISMAAKGILSLAGLGILYRLTHSLLAGVAGSALASLVVLAFYDVPNSIRFSSAARTSQTESGRGDMSGLQTGTTRSLTVRWTALRKLIVAAFPLGMVVLLNSLNMNVPRFFLARYLGAKPLGIYAAMASLLVIGQLFITATGQAAVSKLASHWANRDSKAYARLLKKLNLSCFAAGFVILALSVLCGRHVLSILFTPEYTSQWPAFLWLMGAGLLFYISMSIGVGLTAARAFSIQAWFMLLTVTVVTLFCWILIPRFGVVGASYAMFIGMFVRLAASVAYTRRLIARMT